MDQNLASLYLHADTLGAELVNSVRLAHEHDLELVTVGVVVDVLCEFSVNRVGLDRNVDSNTSFKVDDVGLKSFDFSLKVFHLLQQLKTSAVGFEALCLDTLNVSGCSLQLSLKFVLVIKKALVLLLKCSIFLYKYIYVRLLLIAHLFKLGDV